MRISFPLPQQVIPIVILLASVMILGITLMMEFGFDLVPCILCLYQRLPYFVTTLLAAGAASLPLLHRRVLVALCGVTFGGNAGLAFYHIGIENHWWTASVCTTAAEAFLSLADLQDALARPAKVSCDVVQWSLFGLSLSGYNLLASLGLTVLCMAAASQKSWWRVARNV